MIETKLNALLIGAPSRPQTRLMDELRQRRWTIYECWDAMSVPLMLAERAYILVVIDLKGVGDNVGKIVADIRDACPAPTIWGLFEGRDGPLPDYLLTVGVHNVLRLPLDPVEAILRITMVERWVQTVEFSRGPTQDEQRVKDRIHRLSKENDRFQKEIADRKSAQQALRESVERLELTARGANEGLWDCKLPNGDDFMRDAVDIWFSPRFKELLGYEDYEFENDLMEWKRHLHPEDHDRVIQALTDHVRFRLPYDVQYRLQTKDGEWRWYQARGQAVWNENGVAVRMAGSLRDVTHRRAAEVALRESEERYRKLVELSPDAIAVFRGNELLYVNPAGVRMIGATSFDELRQHPVSSFFSDADAHRIGERLDRIWKDGDTLEAAEEAMVRIDGQQIDAEITVAPIVYDGQPAGLAVARDITERKRAERAVLQEQRLLRELLAAHERERQLVAYEIHDGLTQYLMGAVMRLQRMQRAPEDPEPQDIQGNLEIVTHFVRTAIREARRLISGLRPPILDERGIVPAIEYLVQEPRGENAPQIEFDHSVSFGRLAPVFETAIFRIVQEALTNACRYSKARTCRVTLAEQDDGKLLIEVEDDGIGFDLTTVPDGKFGLQGIRERARLFGGRAAIASIPKIGTTVSVLLPMMQPSPILKTPLPGSIQVKPPVEPSLANPTEAESKH